MAGKLSRTDKQQLEDWIGTGQKDFTLLYSATRDGCSNTAFHQKCDNQGATVTVLYNQHGTVYGGYTLVSWSTVSTCYANSGAEFLFRLHLNQKPNAIKFPIKNLQHAIYNNPNYGPTFGTGHDLNTFQGTINKSGDTFALNGNMNNFGNSYDTLGVPKSEINNDTMTVTELEVYKVSARQMLTRDRKPWRNVDAWNEEVLCSLKEEILAFSPLKCLKMKNARIVLIGPVGAGKSSFVNTVYSVFTGYVSQKACTGNARQSITTMYMPYQIRARSNDYIPQFRICDTPGIEEGHCLDVFELNHLFEGRMPDYYQVNPNFPLNLTTPGFVATPSLDEQIHCVIFVLDATKLDNLSTSFKEKLDQFKLIIYRKGIPHMLLLTKVDQVCRDVKEDVTNMYKSVIVEEHVQKAADLLGIPPLSIHPIKNYVNEVECEVNIGIVALRALRHALNCANSFLQVVADRRSDITKGSDTLSSSDDI